MPVLGKEARPRRRDVRGEPLTVGVRDHPIVPSDSITPVNTFRALFHAYFGLDLPLLPDRNYIWPDQGDIYNLVDVTERLAGGPN